jgi:hypothetical protein
MINLTKFCVTCGLKMTKKLRPVNRYDEYTGKREVVVEFHCSNKRMWRFGHYTVYTNTFTHLKKFEDSNDFD